MKTAASFSAGETACNLYRGDAIEVMQQLRAETVDVMFADPPYFLSGGGSTCKSGKRVSVRKGQWDVPRGPEVQHAFACRWIAAAGHLLRRTGSLFVSGTAHSIHRVHRAAVDTLGWQLVNEIVWVKPNPPPNLACTTLTHASETILWLRPPGVRPSSTHFNYAAARAVTGKQMRSVWTDIGAPSGAEKARGGRHPTQKPVALIERVLLLALPRHGVALDPFVGSGTTLEAAVMRDAGGFVGIDMDRRWITASTKRGRGCGALRETRRAA